MLEVVCAVIEDPQRGWLACRRPPGGHLAGLWEFPGGKVETGEDRASALKREIREELGVDIEVLGDMDPVEWEYPEVHIRLWPFRCRLQHGEPVAHEHDALRWCPPNDLRLLEWAPADQPIVDALAARPG